MIDFGPMAGSYDRLRPAGRAWDEVAELTLERLGAPTRLLDIGCGTGRFTRMAAQRLGARAWGVDPSAEMLAQARSIPGGERIGWKCAAAERLPFRDGWFDAAHMHLVLHLVDDRPAALREMARVLGPGGRAAVVTFSPTSTRGFRRSLPSTGRAFPNRRRWRAGFAPLGWWGSGSTRCARPCSSSLRTCSSGCAAGTSRRCTC